jgi:hypothetical protein
MSFSPSRPCMTNFVLHFPPRDCPVDVTLNKTKEAIFSNNSLAYKGMTRLVRRNYTKADAKQVLFWFGFYRVVITLVNGACLMVPTEHCLVGFNRKKPSSHSHT